MQYVNLGTSGLKISRLGLGMMTFGSSQWRPWTLDEENARPVVRRAVELGINFFDTANMYSGGQSEVLTGKLLREFARRDEVVIATKVYHPVDMDFKGGQSPSAQPPKRPNMSGLSRKHILAALDDSLERLGVDYIDLYQIHRFDRHTPIEETMDALHDVVKSGKVRYVGASSMWAWQFASMQFAAQQAGTTRFVSMQNHYNLAYREEEREMIPLCRAQGVGLIPWSPLARGFLAGTRGRDDKTRGGSSRAATDDIAQKYYYQDADYAVVDAVTAVARERGVSNAAVAYAWLVGQPGISAPIVGPSKVAQLEEAVAALDFRLDVEERKRLEAPYQPHPVLGHV
jgi:aryl-alcohol dehydrogenase (NADP+)